MAKRFVTIWFRYLKTDWFSLRQPHLKEVPFVLAAPDHGRLVITAANPPAHTQGIDKGMAVADARAIFPSLEVLDDQPELTNKLLVKLAEWCIRYTPMVAVDPEDGLILEVTGCAHLWGGERAYLMDMISRIKGFGYHVRAALADTIGTAWGLSRFGEQASIIAPGQQSEAILNLPPPALRLEAATNDRLQKLGLNQIRNIMNIQRSALCRRFGQHLLQQLDRALGTEEERIEPVVPVEQFHERLPCLEPIVTAKGIEIALQRLLEGLCNQLEQQQKGLRQAILKCFRIDGKVEQVEIGTNRGTYNAQHLFKLFEFKLPTIEPGLGIELFLLEAPKIEDVASIQEKLWETVGGLENTGLNELIDRMVNRIGPGLIHRYLPAEHHWPERSIREAVSLTEEAVVDWRLDRPRPVQLLAQPEPITVAAPVPDYPPMLFRYKGKIHKIKKADGPERIEREWWLDEGLHRDYYHVEDEDGCRYWLFRSGHYGADTSYQWFLHGFFA
ncbi:DNA polymerase Y family protein [Segetibacter sp. 3557_3]|uniref:Y-family DNA polymerase n=1 Tax=Segetibacter sp. 3557_3 TaxID=2547429 RepID=UPI00105873FB|nr:DNA polymerase Y family protein [Segetibacter sp. 3557_3]TDH20677.1 DNA polymerase Y family protein [Segetibacter sp. 3557_3]